MTSANFGQMFETRRVLSNDTSLDLKEKSSVLCRMLAV